MEGYGDATYGDRLADVYDAWYTRGDADELVALVERVAGRRPARILELAVGTGRIAIPLARRGHDVTGIDVSPAMLARLRAADRDGLVTAVAGDMVDAVPAGPFDVVLVACNSLFMLADPARQAACFAAVAGVLAPGGRFVVEAFVPADAPAPGDAVTVRSMTADRVVLTVASTDARGQRVHGQFVELADGQPVRLRPFVLRYSTPAELDAFAAAAGLTIVERCEDASGRPFDRRDSPRHVSVYGPAIARVDRA